MPNQSSTTFSITRLILPFLIALGSITGCATTAQRTLHNGFSPDRLDRVRIAMNQRVGDGLFAGAVAMIVRNDQTILLESFGDLDRESIKPMRPDSIFRIASMTKPITSVAIMVLVEQGKINLIDPVSKFLPELEHLQVAVLQDGGAADSEYELVPANKPITIYDLLRHTSGLSYGFLADTPVDRMYRQQKIGAANTTLAEMVTGLSKLPLKHQPGTVWEYSFASDVLARVIEVVAEQPIDEFFAEQIFEPLGMIDTAYFVPKSKLDRLASAYYTDPQTGLTREDNTNAQDATKAPAFLGGGYGLYSTASDYARFCRMLLGNGELDGVRLLAPSTVRLMTSDQLGRISENTRWATLGTGYSFGLGFAVRLGKGNSPFVGSTGDYSWAGAWGTGFWIDPQEDLVGVFMIQNYGQLKYRNEFKALAYQAIIK